MSVRVTVAHLGLDRPSQTPVVILREEGGERVLPIFIGTPEANAIAAELRGDKPARPMTHDLFKQVLEGLGGELRRVTIVGLKENTYFAELLVVTGGKIFEVDARPSDSIALALRTEAPIFVADNLLDRGNEGPGDEPTDDDPEALKRFLEKLDPQDLGRFHP